MEIDSLLMNNKLSIISFILFFRWPPAHNYGTNNLVAIVFQLVGDCRGVCNWSNVTYVDALICRRHESLCPHSIRLLAIFMSVNNFLRTMCLWLSQWSLCSDFGWLRKQWSSSMFTLLRMLTRQCNYMTQLGFTTNILRGFVWGLHSFPLDK